MSNLSSTSTREQRLGGSIGGHKNECNGCGCWRYRKGKAAKKKKALPQPLKVFHEDVGVRQIEWVRKWKISQSFPFGSVLGCFHHSLHRILTDIFNQYVFTQLRSLVITTLTAQRITKYGNLCFYKTFAASTEAFWQYIISSVLFFLFFYWGVKKK